MGLHVKYPLFLPGFNETWIFLQIFEKSLNIKFNENLSSGSQVVSCIQTDMTKSIIAFHSFVNAPKNGYSLILQTLQLETLAFYFWVLVEDASLTSSPVIMLFTKGWVFPVIMLKCLSKFLFCSVFDRQTKHCANKLLTASTKQTKSQGLFNWELLNHAVTWCIMCQLTSVASCSTDTWVQVFVRYCIILHVREMY
jgi:hypothetical protein